MSQEQKKVTAAMVIIGNEVLSGRTQDKNLSFVANMLGEIGVDMQEARIIPDVLETVVATVNELRAKHDYIFTSGGIGPTHDDITADCIAAAFGVKLEKHPLAMQALQAHYDAQEADFNEARRRMARIPEGGVLIANPVTDAPGFQIGNVFVMAGVPKIMQAMLEDVAPRLRTGAIVHAQTLKVGGVGEGAVADVLRAAANQRRDLSFGSYPFGHGSVGEIGTHLVIRGRNADQVDAAAHDLIAELRNLGIDVAAA